MDESESGMSIGFIRGLLVHESAGDRRLSGVTLWLLQPKPNARFDTRGGVQLLNRLALIGMKTG